MYVREIIDMKWVDKLFLFKPYEYDTHHIDKQTLYIVIHTEKRQVNFKVSK